MNTAAAYLVKEVAIEGFEFPGDQGREDSAATCDAVSKDNPTPAAVL